jgi:hypothetical protein
LAGKFMPGDKQIVFIGFEPGKKSRTYVQELAGGQPRPVTPEGVVGVNVSPDRAWVSARDANGDARLYPIAGGDPKPIPGLGAETLIRWTPDGRAIFVGQKDPVSGAVQVSKLDLQTGRRTPVREITPISSSVPNGGVGPIFLTPDGGSYVYGYGVTLADLYLVRRLK